MFLLLIRNGLLTDGQKHGDFGAHILLALQVDRAVVILGDMAHNGQPQAGAAGLLGAALIHPIEPFENPALMLRWDADTGISDQTAFFLLGEVVECSPTQELFSMPKDKRTEDYITGRFG